MNLFYYQKTKQYIAQAAGGFEPLAEAELKALGAFQIMSGFRCVYFSAEPQDLYRINYKSRLITRVLAPLVKFTCNHQNDIYLAGKSIDWEALFSISNTFGIFANVSGNNNIRNSQFAALRLKDAIVDTFRASSGKRPNVDTQSPDVWFNIHIEKDKGTISMDTSGGSLHRRGYRKNSVLAPMQETVAAAIVDLTGWDGETPLYDPLCGSGTLLCEALLKYSRIPAGFLKDSFGFSFLPDFDNHLWEGVKKESDQEIIPLPAGLISGSDKDKTAVKAAKGNIRLLPGGDAVAIFPKDLKDITQLEKATIVCNPPYGIRLTGDELGPFYKEFGDFLKQRCKGSTAYIYFGNRENIKKIGLKPSWKKPLNNAGLDGRLVQYEMY